MIYLEKTITPLVHGIPFPESVKVKVYRNNSSDTVVSEVTIPTTLSMVELDEIIKCLHSAKIWIEKAITAIKEDRI